MYSIVDFILNMSLVAATLWTVNKFYDIYMEKKRSAKLSFIMWLIFAGFQLYVEYHKGSGSVVITLVNIILLILIAISGYESKRKVKLFCAISLYVVWALLEMVVYYILSIIALEKIEFALLGSIVSKLIIIIVTYAFSEYLKNKSIGSIAFSYYIGLLFIPAGSIYIAINEFFSPTARSNQVSTMLVYSILLVINIMIFEIYTKLAENFVLEKEKAVYAQQLELVSRNMDEQKEMMENFREAKHNIVNELIVLKDSVEHGEQKCVLENLNKIIKSVNVTSNISASGNSIVDALINAKYAIARQAGIDFRLKIFIPEVLPVDSCDLGIVLGNALDNAIEAAGKCIKCEKYVSISIGIKRETLIFIIKNSYEHSLTRDKMGNLLTTKEENHGHGYGVNSIKKVVEKYQGEMLIEAENNTFTMTIIMNI